MDTGETSGNAGHNRPAWRDVEALDRVDVRLRRPPQRRNRADLCGRAEPLPTRMVGRMYGMRRTVARPGAHVALVFGSTKAVPGIVAALGLATALAGCVAHEDSPRPTSTVDSPAPQGRRIGADADARVYAVAAAFRFARAYLSFQAGRLLAEQVPAASQEVRAALKRLRVPPTVRSRQTKIVGAQLERIDALSARVTVRVRNVDERLTYPLPIDLVRRDGRWVVLSAGDDT
jgi:hypothetical protein